jgi:LmeA-like phospholipid-binding
LHPSLLLAKINQLFSLLIPIFNFVISMANSLLNFQNLGEKTLNKIAEMALLTQIKKAERLTVEVKTDPNLLAQGILASLVIDGRGLVINPSLRMEEMKINLETITVSPLKALRGNIQLTRPSQGTLSVVLSATDIETAYSSHLAPYLPLKAIYCQILPTGLAQVQIILINNPLEAIDLTIKPTIKGNGEEIFLEITGLEGLSASLSENIAQITQTIFQLKNFEIDGISLKIEQIEVSENKLTLQGQAIITNFPSASVR